MAPAAKKPKKTGRPAKMFEAMEVNACWGPNQAGCGRIISKRKIPDLWHSFNSQPIFRGNKLGTIQTPPLSAIKCGAPDYCFLYRCCLEHALYLQVASVMRTLNDSPNSNSTFDCKICRMHLDPRLETDEKPTAKQDLIKKSSSYERIAYQAMTDIGLVDGFVEGPRLLGQNTSSADIWVLSKRLLIYVDGETHFKDSQTPVLVQQQADARANIEAKDLGFHVLRLAYKDKNRFAEEIQAMIEIVDRLPESAEPILQKSAKYYEPESESEESESDDPGAENAVSSEVHQACAATQAVESVPQCLESLQYLESEPENADPQDPEYDAADDSSAEEETVTDAAPESPVPVSAHDVVNNDGIIPDSDDDA